MLGVASPGNANGSPLSFSSLPQDARRVRKGVSFAASSGRGRSSPSSSLAVQAQGKKSKRTGMYVGDLLPGHYLQTLTGTIRGEELFCRPDLSRPWRSVSKEMSVMQVAEKEKEIESLLRLCSDLRTELGNAKSDARLIEHVVMEKKKEEIRLKDQELDAMRREVMRMKALEGKAKEDAEHQIRLLQAQHENEARTLQTEVRLMSDQLVEQARLYDQQLKDLKEIAEREVRLLETRFHVRVQELEAELQATRTGTTAAEKHYQAQVAEGNTLYAKVEAAFADYRRHAEEKRDDLQKVFDRAVQREREATCEAQREGRAAKERLAAAAVDVEEIRHRFVLWSEWILLMLDGHYRRYADACPAHITPITDPRQQELPMLYTPRSLLQHSDAKMTMERVVHRLLELEVFPIFPEDGGQGRGGNGGEGSESMELRRETEMAQITERQHQLRAGIRELEDRCREMESTYSALRTRLHFFSDDLNASSSLLCPQVQPPLPRKCTFVCLAVYEGNLLWATKPSEMQTAITYLHATLRYKRQEYGAYECYADGVCMLLVFEDVIAACRFALDVQEWCLRLPWPAALVREEASCGTVYASPPLSSEGERSERNASPLLALGASAMRMDYSDSQRQPALLHGGEGGGSAPASMAGGGSTVLFHGLRIGAAIHTGLCEVEDTAVPEWRHMGAAFPSSSLGVRPNPAAVLSAAPNEKEAEEAQRTKPKAEEENEKEGPTPADLRGTASVVSPLGTFTGVCRRHFYGRGVLQTVFMVSLAQGGQVLVSDAVWKHPSLRAREAELAGLVVPRSLGRYAVLSLDPASGLEESQTMELFQILPPSLRERRFLPTSQLLQRARQSVSPTAAALQAQIGGSLGQDRSPLSFVQAAASPTTTAWNDGGTSNGLVKGLERVKNFTIAVGITALENQHRAMEEGMQLLQGELRQLHDKSEDMMEKARQTQSQFHLLPPPEMVVQLNELYRLLEEVAGVSEETTEDMRQVEMAQDELRTNLQGVREYLRRYLSDGERENNLKVEHEAALSQLDRLLRDVQTQRQGENERLLLAVNERDQALRQIFQQQQQRLSPPPLNAPASPPSLVGSAQMPTQMLAPGIGSGLRQI